MCYRETMWLSSTDSLRSIHTCMRFSCNFVVLCIGLSKMSQLTPIFWVNSSHESVDSSRLRTKDSKVTFSNDISSLKHRGPFLHLVAGGKHFIWTCKRLKNHNKCHLSFNSADLSQVAELPLHFKMYLCWLLGWGKYRKSTEKSTWLLS